MTSRDSIVYMIKTNQYVLSKILQDVTEEESLYVNESFKNHIKWITGHLVFTNSFALRALNDCGEKTLDLYKRYGQLFGGGSTVSNDPSTYPAFDCLKEELFSYQEKVIEQLNKVSDSFLSELTDFDTEKVPVWKRITFLCMHEFYHAGQIVQIRTALGKSRPFN